MPCFIAKDCLYQNINQILHLNAFIQRHGSIFITAKDTVQEQQKKDKTGECLRDQVWTSESSLHKDHRNTSSPPAVNDKRHVQDVSGQGST